MNPNIPYGQQMPMHGQPPPRRHDMPYAQIPPHMRPHPGYAQYYPQPMTPMAPMMPQYPQHYPPNWYQYPQQFAQHHSGRPQYYPQAPPLVPGPQAHHHHGQIFIPQTHSQSSPRPVSQSTSSYPPAIPPSTASTTSIPQVEIPSRPTSTTSAVNSKKELTPPATPVAKAAHATETPPADLIGPQDPFVPPLPWLSVQDQPFPPRARHTKRRVTRSSLGTEPVTFPLPENLSEDIREPPSEHDKSDDLLSESQSHSSLPKEIQEQLSSPTLTQTSVPLPSDVVSTSSTMTSPVTPVPQAKSQRTPTQSRSVKAAIPVVPVIPVLPHSPSTSRQHRDSTTSKSSKPEEVASVDAHAEQPQTAINNSEAEPDQTSETPPPPPPPPSSWAALLRSKNAAVASGGAIPSSVTNGLAVPKGESLGEVLNEISVTEKPTKVAFLQPRGLVNTGNMCYMNSILQMLVFCVPFFEFLDRVARRASHTFKSETPLIDAMILFMREFPAIDTTTSVDQLRLRLKPEDYERYGDSFIPEYVYNVIKELPRFRDMRRGHQQDAQEFLGFLLEELHEECAHAMRAGANFSSDGSASAENASNTSESTENDSGWMEVTAKQKSVITRSSGAIVTESPVTSIFGGKLRSELKITGSKPSVTLEPYQPLQLDIGSHQVNNITDALKGLTSSETMQGDFHSPRGNKATATKQVFIQTLPPVLILHLKRFHYDATTKRVEKIWKKVGYPLELELPKDVFPTTVRNQYAAQGALPKYKLIGVIYHHGKNANGGHYTVDIRRQDGREWIRVDDTLIRRIRSDDVAEGGSEEDPKVLAAALERHNQGKATGNRFDQIDDDVDEDNSDKVWNQVNGHSRSKSTMSTIINGASTPAKETSGPQTPRDRYSIKDNKVAYLLFYQRITV